MSWSPPVEVPWEGVYHPRLGGFGTIGLDGAALLTAEIDGAEGEHGLLPASAFRSVYVSNSGGYVVFDGQRQSRSCSGSTGKSG